MPVNTAWTKAGMAALKRLEGARNSLYAEAAGRRNSEDDLRVYYSAVQNDPQRLVDWAARHVGPQRAVEEGERFLTAMRRRFDGDNNRK